MVEVSLRLLYIGNQVYRMCIRAQSAAAQSLSRVVSLIMTLRNALARDIVDTFDRSALEPVSDT